MTGDKATEHLGSIHTLDKFLRKTETPGHRLFGVLGFLHYLLVEIGKFASAGKLDKAQLLAVRDFGNRLASMHAEPPASFVELLAELQGMLERATELISVDDEQRAALQSATLYLHSMAFSPPEDLLLDNRSQATTDLKFFASFVKEFKTESDRGAALVGSALVDDRLERVLRAHFLNGDIADRLLSLSSDAPLSSFSSRIKMCYGLGLITEVEYRECDIIRRVRNEFAHKLHGLTFDDQRLSDLCNNLKALSYVGGNARQRFVSSVVTLCMVLWYRPEHSSAFRAQERRWPWHLAV